MVYLPMIKNKQTNLDKPSLEETIKKIYTNVKMEL